MGRDHSETCERCGVQRGGMNNLPCNCDKDEPTLDLPDEPREPTAKERRVLDYLAANGESFGADMLAGGALDRRGTMYVLLARMEDRGFIKSHDAVDTYGTGLPRRVYRLTDAGRAALVSLPVATAR